MYTMIGEPFHAIVQQKEAPHSSIFFIIAKYICIKDPISEVSFVGMMQNRYIDKIGPDVLSYDSMKKNSQIIQETFL